MELRTERSGVRQNRPERFWTRVSAAPEDGCRPTVGVWHKDVPHNLSRRAIHKKGPAKRAFFMDGRVGSR